MACTCDVGDRPGALAALAAGCGRVGANILALQVFPVADGGVVDEVVLDAPDDWDEGRVGDLLAEAGGRDVCVTGCTVHVLQDEPTRYLRAAARLLDEPDRLVTYVEDLLGCDAAGWTPDGGVPLTRAWAPLTDTEHGRAATLAGLVRRARERAGDGGPTGEPPGGGSPVVRLGRVEVSASLERVGADPREGRTDVARPGGPASRTGTAASSPGGRDRLHVVSPPYEHGGGGGGGDVSVLEFAQPRVSSATEGAEGA